MKIGDYVRIINTLESYVEIVRIKELNEYDGYLLDERNNQYSTDEIIKSSPNIIDLIEVGDYVNGQQVCLIDDEYIVDDEIKTAFFTNKNYSFTMFEEDIESIVTKEQFKSMEYRIGE